MYFLYTFFSEYLVFMEHCGEPEMYNLAATLTLNLLTNLQCMSAQFHLNYLELT